MPIDMEEFRTPRFIKYKTRYPLSENKNDRFYKFETNPRGYRNGEFKLPGYNPNHNSRTVEKVNINSDNIQLKPY
jgi:hypothetical protein